MSHEVDYEFANSVSLATLVKLLVAKGFIKVDELLEVERKFRKHNQSLSSRGHLANSEKQNHKRLLKRVAAKRRWSRKVTTRLFGWHWKKISASSENRLPVDI